MDQYRVPIKNEKGEEVLEPLQEKQSDGSFWSVAKTIGGENHEHFFVLDPHDRVAKCICGIGGEVQPHTTKIIDGHIYNLKGEKVI